MWHLVAAELAKHYYVVAIDLRGYGKSSKPKGGDRHVRHGKKAMACDAMRVMDELLKRRIGGRGRGGEHQQEEQFYICAHDRGARVSHCLCFDYPSRVKKVLLLDICLTLAMFSKLDQTFARPYFHWFFLIQAEPLPEVSISTNPKIWTDKFMGGWYAGRVPFAGPCLETYEANLADEQTVHAMCEEYRAAATLDPEEAQRDIEEGRHAQCPLRILWSERGLINKQFEVLDEWRKVSRVWLTGKRLMRDIISQKKIPRRLFQMFLSFLNRFNYMVGSW